MKKFVRLIAALTVLVAGLVSATVAEAQPPLDRSFDIHLFEPAMGPRQLFTVETARVARHMGWGAGLHFDYQNSPLSVYLVNAGDDLEKKYPIVNNHTTAYMYGFFGFLKRFQVALGIPVYWQSVSNSYGELLDDVGGATPGVDGATMGDLRIHFKSFIYGINKGMFNMAGSLTMTFPIMHWAGQDDKFMGDRNVTLWPRFIFEFRYRKLVAAANVGFLARTQKSEFLSSEVSHQFTYGLGGYYQVATFGGWYMDVLAELAGRNGLTTELDENPLEVDAGVRIASRWGLSIQVGAGAGLIKAIGSAKFRIFTSVLFSPEWTDKDNDGVVDYKDKCPEQKEDMDGFEDKDGCPESDNDRDGIPDSEDKCPNKREDFDKYQDKDGCPELDNDGDGVPDTKDNCPMHRGKAVDKGCPPDMLDDDGDKIPNNRDKCKDQPEDKDGFQDDDGCPDPDNDKDGVPDEHDKCPNVPEDKDGNEDGDGCPDPDDDGDGVCDNNPTIQKIVGKFKGICLGADKCPKQLETINGVDDLDGCPDQGAPAVKLDLRSGPGYKGRFLFTKKVEFTDDYGSTLSEDTKAALVQMAHILRLRAAKVIKQVAIMAFTDRTKSKNEAITVTKGQAEAIVTYLIGQGVAKSRLVAIPAGNTNLVCTKRYRRKRRRRRCARKNRRISFFILKIGN